MVADGTVQIPPGGGRDKGPDGRDQIPAVGGKVRSHWALAVLSKQTHGRHTVDGARDLLSVFHKQSRVNIQGHSSLGTRGGADAERQSSGEGGDENLKCF